MCLNLQKSCYFIANVAYVKPFKKQFNIMPNMRLLRNKECYFSKKSTTCLETRILISDDIVASFRNY